jgi:hypothetical protein
MKRITVYQQGTSNVELLDDSDADLEVYCSELSKALQMSNVVLLKTNNSTFIGRPSQIVGLFVEDLESEDQIETDPEESEVEVEEPEKEEEAEIQEDIITDID